MARLQRGDIVRLSIEYDHWYAKRHAPFCAAGDTLGKWSVREVHCNGSVTLNQRGAVRPFVRRDFIIAGGQR